MKTKKLEEQRTRYLRRRQVWEGGAITCACCNLPSALISEGAVLRALPSESRVVLSREEIAALVRPVFKLRSEMGVVCPRCRRARHSGETKLYYVDLDERLRIGPMCLDCVSFTMDEAGVERVTADVPVWVVKCGVGAMQIMERIAIAAGDIRPTKLSEVGPELLY